ncbi:putative lignostilbene dioxygenase [Atractiella rhizophila]|nr:putative lignostilbene dioxygenase [Atractiella rhizophila]
MAINGSCDKAGRTWLDLREPAWDGFDAPCRAEAEVFDCIVDGTIPPQIDGTFFRVAPDPQVVPLYPNEVNFNGDGMISAFRFRNGYVDFKNKWVRTEKLVRERRARHALIGKYRNGYTDNPLVANALRTTANTNVVNLYGHLLALKEDALPYELDPNTLATKGVFNFDGQYSAPTFTAHPKTDGKTGETVMYGYEVKRDGTKDVYYALFDKDCRKIEEFYFQSPYCGIMHDVAITDNYVVFQIYPLECTEERLKRGGNHWVYNEELPMYLGLIPKRNPQLSDVKWFHWEKNYFEGHWSNCFEKDGMVLCDMTLYNGNIMNWWPNKDGKAPKPWELKNFFARFVLDPKATDLRLADPIKVCDVAGEFSRIDDRFLGHDYTYTFMAGMNMKLPYDRVKARGRPFPGFNCIVRVNNKTGEAQHWWPGDAAGVGEPNFIPRSPDAPEGDGFVICLVNRFDTHLSD